MKTFFLILLSFGCVLSSPLFLLSLASRFTPITAASIKGELVKTQAYESAVGALNTKIEATTADAAADDPVATIIVPFVQKEITPSYVRNKVEKLIDDTAVWIGGGMTPPILSFTDLKEKLIRQHRDIIDQLQSAADQMTSVQQSASEEPGDASGDTGGTPPMPFNAGDIQKFLQSDFTIPVGPYLSGMKFMVTFTWYMLLICAGLMGFNTLLIVLIASGLQSKLRWVGITFLLTALWNIPGALLGAGSSVMAATILTENIHGNGASFVKPFIETIITPILLTYTRMTGGVVIALLIVSIGMIVLSFIAKPAEVVVSAPTKSKKRKT